MDTTDSTPRPADTTTEIAGLLRLANEGPSPATASVLEHAAEAGVAARRAGKELGALLGNLAAGLAAPDDALRGDLLAAVARGWMAEAARDARESQSPPLSNHLERLAALHRINQAATASLDLDAMLGTVVSVVRDTVGGDSCSIFLYDPSSNTLTLRATVGLNPDAIGRVTLALGTGITGMAAQERRLIAVADAASHPKYVDYPLVGDQPYQSQVSVPLALRSPDRLVGVLNLLSLRRREFAPDELTFLETAAGEISIAIENARLYSQTDAELQRRISQLSTLQQMSRLVASTLDLPELLRLIGKQTVELTGSVAAELYRLPRGRPDQLELVSRYPATTSLDLDQFTDDLRGIVSDVMATGTSIWRRLAGPGGEIWAHALPTLRGRRAVGGLCVIYPAQPPAAEDAEGLLHAFADSAAIAIENAELYEEARRGYRRASTLLQEMHHRVRNNLQTVAALLSMQARRAEDQAWVAPLNQAVARIQSIAAIHDLLSGGNLRDTTVDAIARYVVDEVSTTLVDPESTITFTVEPSDVRVSSREATILALLINEFVANAIQHGFAGRDTGHVLVRATSANGQAVVEIQDDGVGFLERSTLPQRRGLGLQIAETLAQVDLRGQLDIGNRPEGGASVRLRFRPEAAAGDS